MFETLEKTLLNLIDVLPLEVFVLVASFVEEVVAPIPSPTVMVLSGSIAQAQEYMYPGLIVLAVIGACGKTLGAFLVYRIVALFEDVFIIRFGRFFGVTIEDITKFGQRLTGKPRDYALLTLFRSLPFVPSVVVSVGCGMLKVPMRMFLITTFLGTIIRDGVYLYAGYISLQILKDLIRMFDETESVITYSVIAMALLTLAGLWYYQRKKRTPSTQ